MHATHASRRVRVDDTCLGQKACRKRRAWLLLARLGLFCAWRCTEAPLLVVSTRGQLGAQCAQCGCRTRCPFTNNGAMMGTMMPRSMQPKDGRKSADVMLSYMLSAFAYQAARLRCKQRCAFDTGTAAQERNERHISRRAIFAIGLNQSNNTDGEREAAQRSSCEV